MLLIHTFGSVTPPDSGTWRVVCSEWLSMRHYDNGDDGSLSWRSLGFLPHALMYRFWEIFTHVHVLASSFEDEQGAEELLLQCTSEAEYLESGRRWRDSLMDWRTSIEPHSLPKNICAVATAWLGLALAILRAFHAVFASPRI